MAAASSVQKLCNLLECPICMKKINNPKAFPCLHFYCAPCIDDLKPVTEGSNTGHTCPVCREFATKQQLRKMHFMHDILEILDQAQADKEPCATCDELVSVWRCNDCKETFCEPCKKRHDKFGLFKNHTGHPVAADGSVQVIDKHVFCKTHPEEIAKLHCRECKKLICIMCNATEHKHHNAESVEEALKSLVTIAQENKKKIEKMIGTEKTMLATSKASSDNITKNYDSIEKQIDERYDEVVRQIEKERIQLKQELHIAKKKQVEEINKRTKLLELQIISKKNVVHLFEETMTKTKGTSQLQALESGMSASLQSMTHTTSKLSEVANSVSVRFDAASDLNIKVIGKLVEAWATIPRTLTGVTELRTKELHKFTTDYKSISFTKIGEQIYHPDLNSGNVHITSLKGDKIKTISVPDARQCYAVAKTQHGAVIATVGGLFITDFQGQNTRKLMNGFFSDVSTTGADVYALDWQNGMIYVLRCTSNDNNYIKQKQIQLGNFNGHNYNTMTVTNDNIFIGQYSQNMINQYTLSGEFIATHGGQGQFHGPRICGVDKDGALLIVNIMQHNLTTLTPDGKITYVFSTEGWYPYCANLTTDTLLVRHGSPPKRFQIFALE